MPQPFKIQQCAIMNVVLLNPFFFFSLIRMKGFVTGFMFFFSAAMTMKTSDSYVLLTLTGFVFILFYTIN